MSYGGVNMSSELPEKDDWVQYQARFNREQMEALRSFAAANGKSVMDVIRRGVEHELAEAPAEPEPVPVLGYIPGGPEMHVKYLPEGTTALPPFRMNPDCYALMVTGDSMTSDAGLSIPDGSYAFFCPDRAPAYGMIVHAEFPHDSGDGDHYCTLKKYCPRADGTVVLEPLNKRHKPIKTREGQFVIRGVFIRAWDGSPLQ